MIIGPQYATPDWERFRCGKVTASRFGDAMTPARGKAGGMGKTAEAYMWEVVASHFTGKMPSGGSSRSMERGKDKERDALDRYIAEKFMDPADLPEGRIIQREGTIICATPDGFVDDDPEGPGILEVKCPDSKTHLPYWLACKARARAGSPQRPPDEYVEQVQGQLWVAERKWCDFISFDDRFVNPQMQIIVVRVYRDEAFIADMAAQVTAFAAQVQERIAETAAEIESLSPAQREDFLSNLVPDQSPTNE